MPEAHHVSPAPQVPPGFAPAFLTQDTGHHLIPTLYLLPALREDLRAAFIDSAYAFKVEGPVQVRVYRPHDQLSMPVRFTGELVNAPSISLTEPVFGHVLLETRARLFTSLGELRKPALLLWVHQLRLP